MKKNYALIPLLLITVITVNAQRLSVNTTGAANSTSSMFEVIQPGAAASGTIGLFSQHGGTATNAYAIWAEATNASAINKYAIVVPSGGGNVGIGTTTPTVLLEVAGQVKITGGVPGVNKILTSDAAGLCTWTQTGLPTGAIMMWSGTIASIPAGWLLCDGTLGTPNLTDQFVYGVNTALTNMNTTGGASTTTLTLANMPQLSGIFTSTSNAGSTGVSVTSIMTPGFPGTTNGGGAWYNSYLALSHTHNTTVTLGTASPTAFNNNPPYYVLAYIIKQ